MIEILNILEMKNHTEGLQAIIFDMDDTLYGEKEYVRSGYEEIAGLLPGVQNVGDRLWQLFEEKKPAIDELLRQEGLDSEELKQECLRAYRYQTPRIHLYEGVEELLKELRAQGFLLGLITDGRPEGQRAKIQALGLEKLVDEIIVTDEFGGPEFRKPNPVAFETMKERLGVDYSRMCYVGDNIKKDFIAPRKLGMKCIWFQNKDGLYAG